MEVSSENFEKRKEGNHLRNNGWKVTTLLEIPRPTPPMFLPNSD